MAFDCFDEIFDLSGDGIQILIVVEFAHYMLCVKVSNLNPKFFYQAAIPGNQLYKCELCQINKNVTSGSCNDLMDSCSGKAEMAIPQELTIDSVFFHQYFNGFYE